MKKAWLEGGVDLGKNKPAPPRWESSGGGKRIHLFRLKWCVFVTIERYVVFARKMLNLHPEVVIG